MCAVALLLVSCSLAGGTGESNGPVERYLSAVSRIKSFDITMRVYGLGSPDSPRIVSTNTMRDVFAPGLGRRFERYVGKNGEELSEIAVKEWDVAVGSGNLSKALHCGLLPGRDYLGYLNPTVGNFFLTDLLRDRGSTIAPLDASLSPAELAGFEVEHPDLNGSVRFWLDSKHGWMLKKVEVYNVGNRSHLKRLTSRVDVDEFIQVEGDIWAPSNGSFSLIVPTGPEAGKAHYGCLIAINAEQSFWNTIKSKELFLAASLPAVNHEKRGWKQYYPEAVLKGIKRADDIKAKMADRHRSRTSRPSRPSRKNHFVVVGLLTLPLAGLVGVFVWRRWLGSSRAAVS
jgi:hypothetical protein